MSEPPSPDGPTARSDPATRLAELLGDVMSEPEREPGARGPSGGERPAPRRRLRRRDLEVDDDDPADDESGLDDTTAREGGHDEAAVVASGPDGAAAGDEDRVPVGPTDPPPPPDPDEPPTAEVPAALATPPEGADDPEAPADGPSEVESPDGARDDGPADDGPDSAAAGDEEPPEGAMNDDEVAGPPVRLRRVTLRAVAFGTALTLLIAAIPALGWIGKERLLTSRGGDVIDSDREPSEPGYLAVVEPTPTALVVHRDAEGTPTSAAVLSLGAGDAGGSVLLVPLTLQVHEVVYFNRIIDGYRQLGDLDAFRRSIEDVLGVALPAPTIELSDDDIATLVAPVAPLQVDVGRPVALDDGTTMSGPTQIGGDQIGPYLRAGSDGESEVARLERVGDVWTAWLDAIGESGAEEPIGAAATGIGGFLRVLAAGPHVVEVLDVREGELVYGAEPYLVPAEGFFEQVIDAVPLPASPRPGRRFTIKLLNGDAGEDLPMRLVRELSKAGGAVEWVGNALELGRSDSLVEYASDGRAQEAELIAGLLGGAEVEKLSARRAEAEGVDLVITVGSEAIEEFES